jgi:hypothetical protein
MVPIGPKVIKAEAVGLKVNDFEQTRPKFDELRWIHLALEYRILNPLAVVETGFGRAAQP